MDKPNKAHITDLCANCGRMYGEHSLFNNHCPNTDPNSTLIFTLEKFSGVNHEERK
jgi:hypothetical protein